MSMKDNNPAGQVDNAIHAHISAYKPSGGWIVELGRLANENDPNALDDDGKSPLARILSKVHSTRDFDRIAQVLLEAGANPLARDQALVAMFKKGGAAWAAGTIEWIAENEAACPLRCDEGGNLLHVIADQCEPMHFMRAMLLRPNKVRDPVFRKWAASGREDDGLSVLHLLWRNARGRGQYSSRWLVTADLINNLNIDPGMVDKKGVSAAWVIHKNDEFYHSPDAECANTKILAVLERERMGERTAEAPSKKVKGARL